MTGAVSVSSTASADSPVPLSPVTSPLVSRTGRERQRFAGEADAKIRLVAGSIPTRFHAFPRPLQKRRSPVNRRGSVGAVASGRRRQCVRARCIARAKARFRARVSHEGSRVLRVTFARPRRAPKMRLLVTRTARQLYERIAAQPVIDSASLGREREREMEIEETPFQTRGFRLKKITAGRRLTNTTAVPCSWRTGYRTTRLSLRRRWERHPRPRRRPLPPPRPDRACWADTAHRAPPRTCASTA